MGIGQLAVIAELLAALLVASVCIEWLYHRALRRFRARLEQTSAPTFSARAFQLGMGLLIDLGGILVWSIAAITAFFLLWHDHALRRTLILDVILGVIIVRTAMVVARFLLAPRAPLRCGGPNVVKAVIRMARDTPVADGAPTGTTVVAYVLKNVGTEKQLHRLVCTTDPLNPISDVVVVHNLAGTPDVPDCTPSPCSSAPGIPRYIEWDVQIMSPGSTSGALTVRVSGQRRQT